MKADELWKLDTTIPDDWIVSAIYPHVNLVNATYSSPQLLVATVPITWANTDEIGITCNYAF